MVTWRERLIHLCVHSSTSFFSSFSRGEETDRGLRRGKKESSMMFSYIWIRSRVPNISSNLFQYSFYLFFLRRNGRVRNLLIHVDWCFIYRHCLFVNVTIRLLQDFRSLYFSLPLFRPLFRPFSVCVSGLKKTSLSKEIERESEKAIQSNVRKKIRKVKIHVVDPRKEKAEK